MATRIEISSLSHGGYGVGRINGQVCFVPYTLPGDVINARIWRQSRGVLWGAVESIVSASPHRMEAPCEVFGQCGGCTWLHFSYPAQREWKCRIVNDCLERIGRIDTEIDWLDDSALRLGYRTRAEFHGVGGALGFYALGTHRVVGITRCPLCHPRLNEALARLRDAAVSGPVEVTVNPEGDDVLIWSAKPNRALMERFPDAQGPRIAGTRRQFLFDEVPVVCGAFSQASLLLNRQLRRLVHQHLAGTRTVLDLYCGSGNLSLGLAADVVGIDHNRAAIAAARERGRGDYRAGDESMFTDAIRERAWDAILLDPPRTGAKPIVKHLAESNAGRLVYVSCDPATLARDLNLLRDAGWKIAKVTAVDMFPNTPHVETVTFMER